MLSYVVHLVSLLPYNDFVAITTALCLHSEGELIVQYSLYTSFVTHCISFGVHQDVVFLKIVTRSGLIVHANVAPVSVYLFNVALFLSGVKRTLHFVAFARLYCWRDLSRTLMFFFLCGFKCVVIIFISYSFVFDIICKTDVFNVRC